MDFEEVPELKEQIEKRKVLEKQLKELKLLVVPEEEPAAEEKEQLTFKTTVRLGKQLKSQIALTKKYKKRECINELREYIFGSQQDKVFIIYGLRRTGKTTMIRQILTELSDVEFKKAVFIQVKSKDTLVDVDADLRLLEEKGFKYVFIDEVTLIEDFIEGAAL
ncbi:MAG: AAA family ATPase [Agathobacter sp.]